MALTSLDEGLIVDGMLEKILNSPKLFVKQVFEISEIIGFETRNKYRICDETGRDLFYAAEQQKGLFGFLFRQFLGHWRTFEIHFFSMDRKEVLIAVHPFRWFFQKLEVRTPQGKNIGAIERRFSILSKRFEVQNSQGQVTLEVSSPIWRIWSFPFKRQGRELAKVSKKWSGFGSEILTDRDNFLVEYSDPSLNLDDRTLVMVAAVYIDLLFFEKKD